MEIKNSQTSDSNKVVYIITTYKCSACKCMEYILKEIQKDNPTFTITTTDFQKVPEWIKNNIALTDFPTVIFIDNDVIKYHFTGTLPGRKVVKIMNDINF